LRYKILCLCYFLHAPSSKVNSLNLKQYTYVYMYVCIYTAWYMYSFILSLIGCSRGTLRPLCSGFVSFVITNGFVKGASRCISKNNHEIWQTTIVRYDIGESINRYRSKKKKKLGWFSNGCWSHTNGTRIIYSDYILPA
jgi:hypothetical protein